jgi:hypothetical protein
MALGTGKVAFYRGGTDAACNTNAAVKNRITSFELNSHAAYRMEFKVEP